MDSVKHIIAVLIPDTVSIFIKDIFPPLFLSPCTIRIQGAHGCHYMEMWVGDTALFLVRGVKGKVGNHTICHKLLLHKLPRQLYIFFHRQFILHSNVKRIGKLGFGVLLTFLHGVPEGCPVKIFFRGMGRQHDFTSNHTAFSRVVADLSIVAAEKTFPGTVGCAGNGALTGTSFNLVD